MSYLYDEEKRWIVLRKRGLDLSHAKQAFEGFHLSRLDNKHSAEEQRFHTVGVLNDGMVVIVVWTWRGKARRIITMWQASDRERQLYGEQRDRR